MAEGTGLCQVATHAPAELADRFPTRRPLTDAERTIRPDEFVRIREETGLLRSWKDGRLIGASGPLVGPNC